MKHTLSTMYRRDKKLIFCLLEKDCLECSFFKSPKESFNIESYMNLFKLENTHTHTHKFYSYIQHHTKFIARRIWSKVKSLTLKRQEEDMSLLVFHRLSMHFWYKCMIINARCLSNISYQVCCKFRNMRSNND